MSTHEIKEKLIYSFIHNLPKAIYMHFFAFSLWLFHGKKKWYYFDHGIFTLHYFSFILLTALIIVLAVWINSAFEENIFLEALLAIFSIFCFLYSFLYFFRSHSRIYNEKKFISRIKGIFIFVINLFLLIFILLFYTIFTLYTLH